MPKKHLSKHFDQSIQKSYLDHSLTLNKYHTKFREITIKQKSDNFHHTDIINETWMKKNSQRLCTMKTENERTANGFKTWF